MSQWICSRMSKQAEKYKTQGNDEFKKGNHAKAIEFYTYATEVDPKNPVYFTNRSMCYYKMKEWQKSLRDAEKAVALNSSWVKGFYRAGMAQVELGLLKEAHANLLRAAELEPGVAQYQQAADDCKQKLYSTMSKAEIIKMEGNDFFKQGEIDKAVAKYTEALKYCQGDDEKSQQTRADLYGNRAMCNQQRWNYSDVVEDCDKCLEINPHHVKALVRRAQAYEALEKYKASLADFELATTLSPNLDIAIKGSIRVRAILRRSGEL